MDKKILLQNLADTLAERTGVTKRKAEAFVRSFFEVTEEGLTNDSIVKVKNFGTTKLVNVSDRESVNINTGERFQIEGHAKISFTPDAFFRDLVNRPFAHFTTIVLDDDVEETAPVEEPVSEDEEVTEETPAVEEETPAVEEETPAAVEEETPAVEEETPAVEEETPAIEEESPISEDENTDEEIEEDDETTTESITAAAQIDGKKLPIIINNTIPEPRHNWWRTAFIALAMIVIAIFSYFAGYFRILCPCNFMGTDAEVISPKEKSAIEKAEESTTTLEDSIAKAKADSTAKAQADSIAKAKADSVTKATQQAAMKLAAEKAAAEKAAQKLAAQQAAVEKVNQRQRDLENSQKFQQMPGSNYLIAGTMQTLSVRRGENLFLIAKRYYGHKDFARYITFYNNIEDPNHVEVGQRIRLPRLVRR